MDKAVFNRLVGRVPNLRVLSPSMTYFDPYKQEVVCEFGGTNQYISVKELKEDLETIAYYRFGDSDEFLMIKDGKDLDIKHFIHPEDKHLW
jgi:hypothetical protein